MNIEGLAQRKIVECEELEKKVNELCAENEDLQKRLSQLEEERSRQKETITELSHASEKTRDWLSKNKKKCEILSQGIQSAKRIMAAVLEVINWICDYFSHNINPFFMLNVIQADKDELTAAMAQVIDFINEDFGS